MDIAYDRDKDEANQAKHGLSLEFGKEIIDSNNAVVVPTFRYEDEEERFKAIAVIDGKYFTAVHVWRGDVARMISVRRSNANEQRDYDRYSGRSQ